MDVTRAEIVGGVRSESMIQKIYKLALEGYDNGCHDWYFEGLQEVKALANSRGGTIEDWAFLLSVYSPRVSVSRAARLALQHFQNPNVKPSGAMEKIYQTAIKYRDRGFMNGKKTEAFRKAILSGGGCNSLVLDVHMAKALEVDQSAMYRVWLYEHIEATILDVQSRLIDDGIELTVSQLQAAIWGGQLLSIGWDISKRALVPSDVLGVEV